MKVYRVENPGKPSPLVMRDEPTPKPGRGEVLVSLRAASLNFRDLLIAADQYPSPNLRKNVIPGSDAAGEVAAVGLGVHRVKVGERVLVNFHQRWIDGALKLEYLGSDLGGAWDGVLADSFVLSEEGVALMPEHLSFEEGAAFGCASITAWASLVGGPHPLRAGETLLIQGSGGVSIFALQFAKALGARVIATTSSEAKSRRLREIGADEVVNYAANPDWHSQVLGLTDGRGVDRVVEVGGPGTLERSIKATNLTGRIAIVGFVGGMTGSISSLLLAGRNISIEAIAVGSRRHLEDSLDVVRMHKMKSIVDRVFPFEQAALAYEHLKSQAHVGKVVVAGSAAPRRR